MVVHSLRTVCIDARAGCWFPVLPGLQAFIDRFDNAGGDLLGCSCTQEGGGRCKLGLWTHTQIEGVYGETGKPLKLPSLCMHTPPTPRISLKYTWPLLAWPKPQATEAATKIHVGPCRSCPRPSKLWLGCPIPRVPSMQIIPTLGPKVYKYDLLWAVWSPRE